MVLAELFLLYDDLLRAAVGYFEKMFGVTDARLYRYMH